ncbi:class I SAM-dependent DNA methyltransferase [Candidatus Dojkabacteria bacterium]|nr:class I SAM-dependent DNA methyltransferase [Candidatus Dojkabacteria bacterium]
MEINLLNLRNSINKAYLKVKPNRTQIEAFKKNISNLFDQIKETESEEFHKNIISEFLKNTYYSPNNYINTKGRSDLVIHNGKDSKSTVGVIFEVKKPSNKSEMPTSENINTKAFHELILYYLRERITNRNIEVKHLIITNIFEWFIFNASDFERLYANNKAFVKQFTDFEEGRLPGTNTDFFYKSLAEPFCNNVESTIPVTHFNIRDFETTIKNADRVDDNKLIALYKIFSPEHLLKLPFANDSNNLDKSFYNELLHIIGLEETKEGGKKLIGRKNDKKRNPGSLIENSITILNYEDCLPQLPKLSDYGSNKEEQLFNIALELVITWINRILFLKLLEGQLIKYNNGDKAFRFLNIERIHDYDELNKLFFHVLAVKESDRSEIIKQKFGNVPYLNSSLFEPSSLEHKTIRINSLENHTKHPVLSGTVLKDKTGKRLTGEIDPLQYLFDFLDSYDFSSEGSEDIQEENKTLINASVLGLIFEKINGYKDGSFFTPGFITMYMCHETIRRAVVQKFNDSKGWQCESISDVYNKIENIKEADRIINSLRICDPAVGSGHFLVSALNEIIAIKSELKILTDSEGKRLKEYTIEVINDEIIITDEQSKLFEYNPKNKESQRVQESLFQEKQKIIENCLFGVDINPNSVKICRLRLWIELLKNAYYKSDKNFRELETLPNIDINIKCGNSLISRYSFDSDIKTALKSSKWNVDNYREAVMAYRNAQSKDEKRSMEHLMNMIKNDFETEVSNNDKRFLKLNKLKGELLSLTGQSSLFELTKTQKDDWNNKVKRITEDINRYETELKEIKNNRIYENAFEWRFEFPEVLNNDGDFVGFDIVIGNPPYIRQEEVKDLCSYFSINYKCFSGKSDIYVYFFELGINILKYNGSICFITSGKYFEASYGKSLVKFLLDEVHFNKIVNFNDLEVFDGVSAYPLIFEGTKMKASDFKIEYFDLKELPIGPLSFHISDKKPLATTKIDFTNNNFKFISNTVSNLIQKIQENTISIKDLCGLPIVGVKTGFNEGFLTDISDPEFVKPYIFGRDIKKYQPITPTKKIIFPYDSDYSVKELINGSVVHSQLTTYKDTLSNRAIIKEGLSKGNKYWYEYQQINKTLNYNVEYIVYPNVSLGNNFSLSRGNIIDMTAFIIKSDNRYLLAILNSKLVSYLMNIWCISRRGGYLEYKVQYMERIPIKNISSREQEPFIELVNRIYSSKNEYNNSNIQKLEKEIDNLVYELYGLTPDEIRIIEN